MSPQPQRRCSEPASPAKAAAESQLCSRQAASAQRVRGAALRGRRARASCAASARNPPGAGRRRRRRRPEGRRACSEKRAHVPRASHERASCPGALRMQGAPACGERCWRPRQARPPGEPRTARARPPQQPLHESLFWRAGRARLGLQRVQALGVGGALGRVLRHRVIRVHQDLVGRPGGDLRGRSRPVRVSAATPASWTTPWTALLQAPTQLLELFSCGARVPSSRHAVSQCCE